MDLVRKIKFNSIYPIEFYTEEKNIIKTLEDYISNLGAYKTPQYYNDRTPYYSEYTFYTHGNSSIPILKNNILNTITLSKPIFYSDLGLKDYIYERHIQDLISFLIKKHLLKKKVVEYNLASNYVDDIIIIDKFIRGITFRL